MRYVDYCIVTNQHNWPPEGRGLLLSFVFVSSSHPDIHTRKGFGRALSGWQVETLPWLVNATPQKQLRGESNARLARPMHILCFCRVFNPCFVEDWRDEVVAVGWVILRTK